MVERSSAPQRRSRGSAILLVASIAATLVGLGVSPAAASALDARCATVDAVFARGSGQPLAQSEREAERFRIEIQRRVDSVAYYELGTEDIDGDQYPAVPVGGDHPINSGGAFITSGGALTYGNSVNEGVDELTKYMRARIALCGDETLFILGGYSQGAQVIGETYNERLTDAEREHVVFNALFGDPKLYLPEGESEWHRDEGSWVPEHVAPFCDGEREKSTWRRTVPDCNTDNGSLGARVPYVPDSWSTSTGLWCNDDDFVCGSSKNPFTVSGHIYSDVGGAIDDGVLEAVERLSVRLGSSDELDTVFVPVRAGRTGLDVVFLIDSTGSMSGQIDQAKEFAGSMSASIAAVNGRVALVEYRDAGDEFTARVLTGLNEDTTEFQSKLDGISVDGGGDTPEAALHALMTGFNGLDWRPGATKAAVILTDAGFHNPDLVDGSTVESVAARSLEIDPVNVYPVVSDDNAAEYEELATATSGEVIINSGDAGTALEEALTTISERPVVQLGLNEYFAEPGTPVYFDASTSYGVSSPIATFDWDFDGDGVFEILDGASAVEYAYPTAGDYFIQVRVTDEDGGIGTHAVPVHIGTDTGKPVLPEPAQSISVTVAADEATVTWDAEVEPTGYWSMSVDGVEIGRFAPDARDARMGDLIAGTEYVFGVRPVSSEPTVGDEITTTATSAPAATVTRIAGVDRQDTAAKLSRETFAANVPVVYIATGGNFPDALSAAPAAAKQNGPLLLVDRDSMSQPVRDELLRLKPTRIVVVGSALSVSESLRTELARYAKDGTVERIGGVDRYDTASKLVESAFPTGSSQAWLATGEKFPDALAAGAAAGSVDAPVLLVNGGLGSADATSKTLVSDLGVKKLTIAGSALSVSEGIKTSLPVASTRIGGVDRYDTSVRLNRAAFTKATTVYLATGEKFPDALSGATTAGFEKSPLYTVKPDCVPQAVLEEIERLGASKVVLLGGVNTLSNNVATLTSCGS